MVCDLYAVIPLQDKEYGLNPCYSGRWFVIIVFK